MAITSSAPNVTTIDRFFGVVQICQNIATMQNNMRDNVVFLRNQYTSGGPSGASSLFNNLTATQQAFRDLGSAFQSRLTMNQNTMDSYPAELSAGAAAIGVLSSEVNARQQLLRNVSSGLVGATFTTSSDVLSGVQTVLNTVPVAMTAF